MRTGYVLPVLSPRFWVTQRLVLPRQTRGLEGPRAFPLPVFALVLVAALALVPLTVTGVGGLDGAARLDRGASADRATAPTRQAIRINAGGDQLIDPQGRMWLADDVTGVRGQRSDSKFPVLSATPQVDRTERYGDLRLAVPVAAPGSYLLRLHLTELYWDVPGKRVFDVWVQGGPVALRVDLLKTGTPGRTQLMDIPVRLGPGQVELELELRRVLNHASITALELLPTTSDGRLTPEPSPEQLADRGTGPRSTDPSAPANADPTTPPESADLGTARTGPDVHRQTEEGSGGVSPQESDRDTGAGTAAAPPAPAAAAPPGRPPAAVPGRSPAAPSPRPGRPAAPAPAASPNKGQAGTVVSVRDFGARGDGRTDDTEALQRAFDEVPQGTTLSLPAGGVFLHSDVLHLRRAGLRLMGPGELRATRQERSSLWIESDRVTVQDLRLTITGVTKRWSAWEQHRVRLLPVRGAVLRRVTVEGSAASGVFVGGAEDFLLDHVTVRGTRADGIHMTSGAHNGRVLSPTTVDTGDDGVAVVSYRQDGSIVHDITVRAPTVKGTKGGRGLSVVGGTNITYSDIDVERSSGAAVYIANEGRPYFTAAPRHVEVRGGRISQANTDSRIDHGAVLVLAGDTARPDDVLIRDLDITQTRSSASRSVGVITYGKPPVGVVLDRLRITGGPKAAYQGNTTSGYVRSRWTVDGRGVPDERH